MLEQYFTNLAFFISSSLGLWFVVWAYRHRYELDRKLDSLAKRIRWFVVIGSSMIGSIPLYYYPMKFVRPPVIILGLGFLLWPNFAYRVRNYFFEK